MPPCDIRAARADDLGPITAIYNHYITRTPATFDITPLEPAARGAWLAQFDGSAPRLRMRVAEDRGVVQGYAHTGPFKARAAYDTTVETTVYLAPGAVGRGIGRALYQSLFDGLASQDVRCLIASITLPNDASLALHHSFGFEHCGTMRDVGRKFGRYWDVAWLQRVVS